MTRRRIRLVETWAGRRRPVEQPKGLIAGIKRSLVKKIWNSLDADQQQQATDSLL